MKIDSIVELYETAHEQNVIDAYDHLYANDHFAVHMEMHDLTACEMIEYLQKLLKLEKTSREEEWGSEKQIEAQNSFFEMIEELTTTEEMERISEYALKATTEEMQDFALEVINESH